jgi:hypothetical protein
LCHHRITMTIRAMSIPIASHAITLINPIGITTMGIGITIMGIGITIMVMAITIMGMEISLIAMDDRRLDLNTFRRRAGTSSDERAAVMLCPGCALPRCASAARGFLRRFRHPSRGTIGEENAFKPQVLAPHDAFLDLQGGSGDSRQEALMAHGYCPQSLERTVPLSQEPGLFSWMFPCWTPAVD